MSVGHAGDGLREHPGIGGFDFGDSV